MWPDNETDRDFLNFEGLADTVAQMIVQAEGRPLSVGISGAWGVGKSSMIKLTKSSLKKLEDSDDQKKFVFVDFNAWLYQGYDDARAALLDVIASVLTEEATSQESGMDKVADFLKRVRWLRLAKLVALPVAALALGIPPGGLAGQATDLIGQAASGKIGSEQLETAGRLATEVSRESSSLIRAKEDSSPPKEIQALRDSFEAALEELNVTLVVLIDDLDRCLPETTISTLEAIRLFLFLKNTAFVIAADDEMIRYAVRKHFGGLGDESLVTNYFDKLIQIPVRVPTLGTHEVRAYMAMLYIENSSLSADRKELIWKGVAKQLRASWQGKRVDRKFIESIDNQLPADLVARLDSAERLSSLMTTSAGIVGNPRLVKRFLNAVSIRMAISKAQGVGVDEAVLVKLLLFERLAPTAAYTALSSSVSASPNGEPSILADWEQSLAAGKEPALTDPWDAPFIREWLQLAPPLAATDLRGALYVSREHAPLEISGGRLSAEGSRILAALLSNPDMADALKEDFRALPPTDLSEILDKLLSVAQQEQEWGTPPVLSACIAVVDVDPSQGSRLAGFLVERPPRQIRAGLIPRIDGYSWANEVFDHWATSAVSSPVKNAIKAAKKNSAANGNL
ncbi:ATPase [Arthrobacter sp. MYb23]|uniref:KAP family P-loop NTPase fold protein n=1 Tax=unclassified Arthrobacter TaxID=235627 RepID=UPI000CFB5FEB|nr:MULTISPECIES: P-loop NTPase fold protein [unclassified Arthrobacter]PRB41699.1 ATPase [Arthrobacter sp. MYb51]PRB96090.1 ATPase [Arthrobacter sp. MYb23]